MRSDQVLWASSWNAWDVDAQRDKQQLKCMLEMFHRRLPGGEPCL